MFPPAVLLLSSNDTLRAALAGRLRHAGWDVLELSEIAAFHDAIRSGCACDAMIVDTAFHCSPMHGVSFLRSRGADVPVIALASDPAEPLRDDARRLDVAVCDPEQAVASIARMSRTSRAA